jgi:hypothetical protein
LWIQQKKAKDAPTGAMNDRENALNAKFAHDAAMQFKAEARRNKLLVLWAADLLGKTGADAQADAVEDVFRKVSGYLDGRAD